LAGHFHPLFAPVRDALEVEVFGVALMFKRMEIVLLVAGLALAAPARAQDTPADPPENKQPLHLGTEPVESCVARWDPGTHMTKSEWEDTCKRISEERGEYLRKQEVVPDPKE
jgi:hypothetical protein